MKQRLSSMAAFGWLVLALSGSSLAFTAAATETPPSSRPWISLENTEAPPWKVPDIQRLRLANGMRLLLLEDHEMPVVRGFLYLRGGSTDEPEDKPGLATLASLLLRSGGSVAYPGAKLDERLAKMGAEIETEAGKDFSYLSFRCLKADLPEVLDLVLGILKTPAWPQDRLELAKSRMIESIRRQNDQVDRIASREFPKIVYGPGSLWARSPTIEDVQGLSREDLMAFQKFFTPTPMVWGLTGDFSSPALQKMLVQKTQDWLAASETLPAPSALRKTWAPERLFLAKKTDQATVMLGHFGDKRFNPDKFALILLNDILGGDLWDSRLGSRVRSELGLAYGIYSQFGLETDYGVFRIFAQTRAEKAGELLRESEKILAQLVDGKSLSEGELKLHQQSVLNALYAQYEPHFNFVKDEAKFGYYGYPENYLQSFREEIQKVTLADLRRVAKAYLKPEALKVLVIGDPGKVGKLAGFKEGKL